MTRTSLIVAFGLALSAGIAAPGCAVRGSGYVGVSSTPVVYQEPPQPQVEQVSTRPGHLWVRGRWDWQNGQWQWIGGHWERERAGYAWNEGRWERRGNSWHWIDGTWGASGTVMVNDGGGANGWQPNTQGPANGGAPPADNNPPNNGGTGWQPNTHGPANGGAPPAVGGGMYPTVAPPPMRVENYGAARSGFTWVSGRWAWRSGNWAWEDGHWERERANQMWVAGRWELQGNYYVWVEGRWDRQAPQPQGPVVRDHR